MTEKMKPSGIGWLGDIPESWNVKPLKYLAECNQRVLFENTRPDYRFRYVDIGSVSYENGIEEYQEMAFEDAPSRARRLVNVGDTIISTVRTYLKAIALVADEKDVVVSTGFAVYHPGAKLNPRFLYYFCKSEGFVQEIDKLSYGIAYPAINTELLSKIGVSYPSFPEQVAIADFLDAQCAKIDGVIVDIEQQIETLQKYKKSLITEAVTKGLKPDVPMRMSKVEYVSSVPDHWEEKRLNIVAYVRARLGWRGLTADEYVDEGYAFLSAFNIVDDKLDLSEELLNYITKFRYDESPEIKLHSGDVLLVKDGAGLGKCARIDNLPFETAPNGSLAVITPNEQLHYRYLYYFFVGDVFQQRINQIKNGMGVPHLPQGDLRKVVVPIPPMDEQIAISDYLDERCALVNPLLEAKEKQLETMKQHKKSLIYEYVTGKKRVTEVN